MMMNEFIERTGIEPTAEEYNEIEEAYYKFDGDKDAFCRDFVKKNRTMCGVRLSCIEIDSLSNEHSIQGGSPSFQQSCHSPLWSSCFISVNPALNATDPGRQVTEPPSATGSFALVSSAASS